MSATDPEGQGIELPLRGTASQPESSSEHQPRQPPSCKRRTLAEMGQRLEAHSGRGAATTAKTKALAIYSLVRVAANLSVVGLDDSYLTFDAVLRPAMTGFGIYAFLRNNDRFSEKSALHIWSRRTIFALAFFVGDPGFRTFTGRLYDCVAVTLLWEIACNVMQVHMTNLKLVALGLRRTSVFCQAISVIGVVALLLWGSLGLGMAKLPPVEMFCETCCVVTVVTQSCSLSVVACRALWVAGGDQAIRSIAWLLLANAVLVIIGPFLSFQAWYAWYDAVFLKFFIPRQKQATWLTLDLFLQICNTLTLSGMIGPKQWNHPMDAFRQLADLSGFGFASKRVAFPGHINQKAAKCIVSFPGKYSELWDEAVSSVTTQAETTGKGAWSLACVFLTDAASGLGQHAENPEEPGKCWCHSLYGRVPASTYLSVAEVEPGQIDSPANRKMLAFKRRDAEAMGQLLVIKSDQSDIDWQKQLVEATKKAEDLCAAKDGRAPWGCQWFQEWKQNLDLAVDLKQELHVFYFEGRKGQGKLAWKQLPDDAAKERARQHSGLGASQTAEVAYLEKMGFRYVEHDIRDFQAFILAEG